VYDSAEGRTPSGQDVHYIENETGRRKRAQFGAFFPGGPADRPDGRSARLACAEERERARRQATAAATLLLLGQTERVWPLWRHSSDPTVRNFLVQRAGLLGVDGRLLVERLEKEKDNSARRALIVALGEYGDRELPADVRGPLVKKMLSWDRDDPDAGLHGAIDWLLRHGKEGPAPRLLDWGRGQSAGENRRRAEGARPGREARLVRERSGSDDGAGQGTGTDRGPRSAGLLRSRSSMGTSPSKRG
jgi:hypothetical protein